MAIAFDAIGTFNATSSSSPGTWTHIVGGADTILLVSAGEESTGTFVPGTVTYNGVSLTKIVDTTATNNSISNSLWYLINPTTGTNNVVVKYGVNKRNSATSISLNGVDQTTPIEGSAQVSVGATSGSVSITTVADNAWVVGAGHLIVSSGTGGGDATTGQTDRVLGTDTTDNAIIFGNSTNGPITPAASTKLRYVTTNSNGKAIVAASIVPAGGVAATVKVSNRMLGRVGV